VAFPAVAAPGEGGLDAIEEIRRHEGIECSPRRRPPGDVHHPLVDRLAEELRPPLRPNVVPVPRLQPEDPHPLGPIVLDILHCITYYRGMKRAAKSGDPKVAVAYLRVSTQEQDLGPEAQRAAIDAWAERQGVRVVSYFEDRLSGGTKVEDRPAMLEAFGALRSSGAGLLVAAKRDRIARDVVVAATVEQMARAAGAKVVTADGTHPRGCSSGGSWTSSPNTNAH